MGAKPTQASHNGIHPDEHNSQIAAWTRDHNPYILAEAAIETASVHDLSYALHLAERAVPQHLTEDDLIQFLDETFRQIEGSAQSQDLMLYMLDERGVPISRVSPSNIARWMPPKPIIMALVYRGWDINTQDQSPFEGQTLLQHVVRMHPGDQDLIRWLVEEQGARVDIGQFDEDYNIEPRPPPLLETCAQSGCLSLFKYLESKGAKHSRRLLHKAVYAVAWRGLDPAGQDGHSLILRYLVDERGLDVNAMDATVSHGCPNLLQGHWGTPLYYAVRCNKGAPVVKWLLEKGADPTIKREITSGRNYDSSDHAKEAGCDEIFEILEQWRRDNNGRGRD